MKTNKDQREQTQKT